MPNAQSKHKQVYNSQAQSSFWFGLMMGGVVGSAALYAFGTKDGRSKLRKLIDIFENMDKNMLDDIESMIKDSSSELRNIAVSSSNISQVLDKIQSNSPLQKEIKKYFKKEGKVLK